MSSSQILPPPTDEDFLVALESALEKNLLPAPGFKVLERTRDDVVAALAPLVAQLRRERDLAIAHDRQPYPTAWAYEQACKALRRHQERAEAAEEHRLALSEALGLGTGAPWDAIRERADAVLAALPASVDRADVLREEAALIRAHCPDHLDADSAEGSWMDCHCAVADDMERRATDEAPGEAEATESVIYEVVGDWGVDSADSAEGARAAVAKWLRAYPKCGAYAQQRIVRDWPDGSEYYGPWTDLPEQPAGGAPQPNEEA